MRKKQKLVVYNQGIAKKKITSIMRRETENWGGIMVKARKVVIGTAGIRGTVTVEEADQRNVKLGMLLKRLEMRKVTGMSIVTVRTDIETMLGVWTVLKEGIIEMIDIVVKYMKS
jgi:hypothetical protein